MIRTAFLVLICLYRLVCYELNVARLAKLNVSSTVVYNNGSYNKSNAVDGVVKAAIDTCGCCFSSGEEIAPYFEAQLKRQYHINQIIVIGRQDTTHYFNDLSNIEIYLDNIKTALRYEEATNTIIVVPSTPTVQTIMIQKHKTTTNKPALLAICEIKIMVSVVNIASSASLRASPKLIGYGEMKKENAVDGIVLTRDNVCECCYCSNNSVLPFFDATLPGRYDVLQVVIDGKSSGSNAVLRGIKVFLDGRFLSDIIINPNNTAYVSVNMNGQVVRVEHKGKFLFICEIRIFVPECHAGTFGPDCNHDCQCINDEVCNNITGECANGCAAGWRGNNCSLECIAGTFGPGCKHDCHCINDEVCNSITGDCANGCAAGWRGNNCSLDCSAGTFGPCCKHDCHCINDEVCNRITGNCANGCAAGWRGNNCSLECIAGTFGQGCKHHCHCINDEVCNNITGDCANGCAAGWRGSNCSLECIAGTFGQCCKHDCHCINDEVCKRITGDCANGCAAGWRGNNCSLECNDGTFGPGCKHDCHCINEKVCNNITGECSNGCAAGWRGNNCSQECNAGSFGPGCKNNCHCINEEVCSRITGDCANGCAAGWRGKNCSLECVNGTFGSECLYECHCLDDATCNINNGSCHNGCAAGYTGGNCNEVCLSGKFGPDCLNECHCVGEGVCDSKTGFCENGCTDGYMGNNCSIECTHGMFGSNCSYECHCIINSTCDRFTGNCSDGCDYGWDGFNCSEVRVYRSDTQQDNDDSGDTTVIGIAVTAAVVVLLIVAGLVVFIRRRQTGKPEKDKFSGELNPTLAVRERTAPVYSNHGDMTLQHKNKAFEDETEGYYNIASLQGGIKLTQLWHYIRKHQEENNKNFYDEFKELPNGLIHPYKDSQKIENKGKNRYNMMYAYDHNRVHLDITGPDETDYINASHINGHKTPKKFIAAQGPTDKNVNDFWRMIWQQDVSIIVMLTNPMEAGSVKCIVYWPEDTKGDVYGSITVRVTRTEDHTDYLRRDMVIRMNGLEEKRLSQFHFKAWPDKDVPDSTWCLVHFWREATRKQGRSISPVVVHCSAGIGRTGTYIALDILYNQMVKDGSVQPLDVVKELRQQRVNMVQTKEQYAYLHEALADALSIGTHFIWSSQLASVYQYMSERIAGTQLTGFGNQYKIAVESLDQVSNEAVNDDVEYANTSLTTEMNAYRPNVRKRSSKLVQEMGAMYLPCFSGGSTFLIAKSPSGKSLVEFWSLVHEENVKTVISLCDPSAKNYQACCSLGENTEALKGMFRVEKTSETKTNGCTERTFKYQEHGTDKDSERKVKVFDYTAWKSGYSVPGDATSLLSLLERVFICQPHISESQPILVHCGDGKSRCGLVCLVMSELQRLKKEDGQLNILDSFMRMRKRNNEVITSMEQYKFCYDALMAHFGEPQTPNIYENVAL